MNWHPRVHATVGRAQVVVAVGALAALAGLLGWLRRDSSDDVARAALWPRPDGSMRSFGEVWDIHEPTPGAASGHIPT